MAWLAGMQNGSSFFYRLSFGWVVVPGLLAWIPTLFLGMAD
jgi:hypothetical protein